MTEDWMRETMHDLRTDSPYYHEMQETLRDHYRKMDELAADERAEIMADLDDEEEEEDDWNPRDDPRFF